MHIFRVIPPKPKVVTPGDIDPPIFANRSSFFPIKLLAPVSLTPEHALQNLSTFGRHRLTTGDEVNLTAPLITNSSLFGDHEVDVGAATGTLRPTIFTNESTFGALTEIDIADPDVLLRPVKFTNVSTFGSLVVGADEDESVDDGMIDGGMIAGETM